MALPPAMPRECMLRALDKQLSPGHLPCCISDSSSYQLCFICLSNKAWTGHAHTYDPQVSKKHSWLSYCYLQPSVHAWYWFLCLC